MKFLVVDDSAIARQKIINVLKRFQDVEIDEAANGEEALTFLDLFGEDYTLMVLDWHMPKLSGLNVLEKMKQDKVSVPVLMATTEQQKEEVVKAVLAGAKNYIVKPFSGDEVFEKLENIFKDEGIAFRKK